MALLVGASGGTPIADQLTARSTSRATVLNRCLHRAPGGQPGGGNPGGQPGGTPTLRPPVSEMDDFRLVPELSDVDPRRGTPG